MHCEQQSPTRCAGKEFCDATESIACPFGVYRQCRGEARVAVDVVRASCTQARGAEAPSEGKQGQGSGALPCDAVRAFLTLNLCLTYAGPDKPLGSAADPGDPPGSADAADPGNEGP